MIVLGKVHCNLIFVVYIHIVIVLIITAIDRYGLYCSSVSLLETLNNPTPFCKFSGKITHLPKTFIFNAYIYL